MMACVATGREDEPGGMQPANGARRHRHMCPAMKLIGQEEEECGTRSDCEQEMVEGAVGDWKYGDEENDGNRDECVVARDLKEIMSCDFEWIVVMFAKRRDQHGTENSSVAFKKTVGDPMGHAGEKIGE